MKAINLHGASFSHDQRLFYADRIVISSGSLLRGHLEAKAVCAKATHYFEDPGASFQATAQVSAKPFF